MKDAITILCVAVALSSPAAAQTSNPPGQDQSQLGAEFSKEREKLSEACGAFDFGAVGSCAFTLATANPLHIAIGSIAPGNGVAFGPAFVGHHTPNESLRMTWSADMVAAPSGSWRGGAYLNFVPTRMALPTLVFDDQPGDTPGIETSPVFSVYGQAISLERLRFYGLGADSTEAGLSNWTMRQHLVGGRAIFPVRAGRLGVTLTGEVNGRFIRTGASADGSIPSIDQLYSPAVVPGMNEDRRFLQIAGGVRLAPPLGIHVRPSYQVRFDRFISEADAHETFSRWTVDLIHEFPFYRTQRPASRATNTPNDCAEDPTSAQIDEHFCAAPSRNRYGAVSFRVVTAGSQVAGDSTVPFYLQPTLGGSDINGNKVLSSFPDYRFRGLNMFALQATIEHTLPALPLGRIVLPLGAFFMVERGRVADEWSDVFGDLRPSYAAGLTIRAGGFPEVYLLFAFGGDSNHFTGSINPALLGASGRPSLY